MDQNYNSRKRKIYNDYSSVPYEKLIEIVKNSNDYKHDVIEVVKDILRERGASIPEAGNFENNDIYKPGNYGNEPLSYIDKLREKEPEEILSIITRYSEFLPDAVEAALTVAVTKGLITVDLKNSLGEQISSNRTRHWNRDGHFQWEKKNAFAELVNRYSDDDIYKILEDPSGIVIDVYHAVLITALGRELISHDDFTDYFENAKLALRDDREIEDDTFNDLIRETPLESLFNDNIDPKIEKEKFWKCPNCSESVSMDLNVCWNCEASIPENILHPSDEDLAKDIAKDSGPGLKPFIIIGAALTLIIGAVILRGSFHGRRASESLLIFAGCMVVVLFYNLIFKKQRK